MDAVVDDGRLPGAPNGDNVGFVSLNEAGDQSGSFHPSETNKRRIVARSMKDNVDVEPNKDDLPGDTFDATVIELDVGDFLNRSTPVLSREPKLAN